MRKRDFIEALRKKLSNFPKEDVEERLTFYSEMIDDRIEEGLTEETAVSEIGSVEEIAAQITADIPLPKIVTKNAKSKKRLNTWEIVLLSVGSPIWFSLLIAAFAVLFSLYASLWAVIVSIWAVFASLIACAFAGVLFAVVLACSGNAAIGIASIAASLVCAGLGIFLFFGCKTATNSTLLLTKKIALCVKRFFSKKENA